MTIICYTIGSFFAFRYYKPNIENDTKKKNKTVISLNLPESDNIRLKNRLQK
jgi:hypothetical protein